MWLFFFFLFFLCLNISNSVDGTLICTNFQLLFVENEEPNVRLKDAGRLNQLSFSILRLLYHWVVFLKLENLVVNDVSVFFCEQRSYTFFFFKKKFKFVANGDYGLEIVSKLLNTFKFFYERDETEHTRLVFF